MAEVSKKQWEKYKNALAKLSDRASEEFRKAVWSPNGKWKGAGIEGIPRNDLVYYAHSLIEKYSEGASALACDFYDELAEKSGVSVPLAVAAESADMATVGKTINGTIKYTDDEEVVSSAVGRLVKRAGQDTTLYNAIRDHAEFAWIPAGDTCAFCLAIASEGWRPATTEALKGGHAEHIHANCDCAYAIRFTKDTEYKGYHPDRYQKMYYDAPLDGDRPTSENRINAMRREAYAKNKEKINAQKRSAYAKRKERESSRAEEINVN